MVFSSPSRRTTVLVSLFVANCLAFGAPFVAAAAEAPAELILRGGAADATPGGATGEALTAECSV